MPSPRRDGGVGGLALFELRRQLPDSLPRRAELPQQITHSGLSLLGARLGVTR